MSIMDTTKILSRLACLLCAISLWGCGDEQSVEGMIRPTEPIDPIIGSWMPVSTTFLATQEMRDSWRADYKHMLRFEPDLTWGEYLKAELGAIDYNPRNVFSAAERDGFKTVLHQQLGVPGQIQYTLDGDSQLTTMTEGETIFVWERRFR